MTLATTVAEDEPKCAAHPGHQCAPGHTLVQKKVYRDNGRRCRGQQPGTKSGPCRINKPVVNCASYSSIWFFKQKSFGHASGNRPRRLVFVLKVEMEGRPFAERRASPQPAPPPFLVFACRAPPFPARRRCAPLRPKPPHLAPPGSSSRALPHLAPPVGCPGFGCDEFLIPTIVG